MVHRTRLRHYRCYQAWVPETRAEQTSSTLVWLPKWVPIPHTSSQNRAIEAAEELIHALNNPEPSSPLAPITDKQQKAMKQLAEIFQKYAKQQSKTDPAQPSVKDTPVPRVEIKKGNISCKKRMGNIQSTKQSHHEQES